MTFRAMKAIILALTLVLTFTATSSAGGSGNNTSSFLSANEMPSTALFNAMTHLNDHGDRQTIAYLRESQDAYNAIKDFMYYNNRKDYPAGRESELFANRDLIQGIQELLSLYLIPTLDDHFDNDDTRSPVTRRKTVYSGTASQAVPFSKDDAYYGPYGGPMTLYYPVTPQGTNPDTPQENDDWENTKYPYSYKLTMSIRYPEGVKSSRGHDLSNRLITKNPSVLPIRKIPFVINDNSNEFKFKKSDFIITIWIDIYDVAANKRRLNRPINSQPLPLYLISVGPRAYRDHSGSSLTNYVLQRTAILIGGY